MKNLFHFIFFLPTIVLADVNSTVNGFVRDFDNGEPLPWVNVVVKDTELGAATNDDGYYVIHNLPPGDYVLVYTMMGYERLEETVQLKANTTNKVDVLCIIAESSPIGEMTARRIYELSKKLEIEVKQTGIIWNKTDTPGHMDDIPNFGCIPCDPAIIDASMQGKTIFDIKPQSPAIQAIKDILKKISI